ncbi:hypothetical protein H6G17_30845 [Chroococcidiopsis sp. FACHB-1243]|nr:hypothetical protein [Chroococcidiopsis sp. [FACHB-1243]]
MPKYICSLDSNNAWHLSPEKVAQQTFSTEEEAKQWFYQNCPDCNLEFSGFHLTIHLPINFVLCNGQGIGQIIEYSNKQ